MMIPNPKCHLLPPERHPPAETMRKLRHSPRDAWAVVDRANTHAPSRDRIRRRVAPRAAGIKTAHTTIKQRPRNELSWWPRLGRRTPVRETCTRRVRRSCKGKSFCKIAYPLAFRVLSHNSISVLSVQCSTSPTMSHPVYRTLEFAARRQRSTLPSAATLF